MSLRVRTEHDSEEEPMLGEDYTCGDSWEDKSGEGGLEGPRRQRETQPTDARDEFVRSIRDRLAGIDRSALAASAAAREEDHHTHCLRTVESKKEADLEELYSRKVFEKWEQMSHSDWSLTGRYRRKWPLMRADLNQIVQECDKEQPWLELVDLCCSVCIALVLFGESDKRGKRSLHVSVDSLSLENRELYRFPHENLDVGIILTVRVKRILKDLRDGSVVARLMAEQTRKLDLCAKPNAENYVPTHTEFLQSIPVHSDSDFLIEVEHLFPELLYPPKAPIAVQRVLIPQLISMDIPKKSCQVASECFEFLYHRIPLYVCLLAERKKHGTVGVHLIVPFSTHLIDGFSLGFRVRELTTNTCRTIPFGIFFKPHPEQKGVPASDSDGWKDFFGVHSESSEVGRRSSWGTDRFESVNRRIEKQSKFEFELTIWVIQARLKKWSELNVKQKEECEISEVISPERPVSEIREIPACVLRVSHLVREIRSAWLSQPFTLFIGPDKKSVRWSLSVKRQRNGIYAVSLALDEDGHASSDTSRIRMCFLHCTLWASVNQRQLTDPISDFSLFRDRSSLRNGFEFSPDPKGKLNWELNKLRKGREMVDLKCTVYFLRYAFD